MRHRSKTAARAVGQAGSLRGGCLPPPSSANVPVGRLPIVRSLPSCPTTAPSALRALSARLPAKLPRNRGDGHFYVAHPLQVPTRISGPRPDKLKKASCGRGEIGRRTRLRIWRGNPWEFKSPRPHHQHSNSPQLPRNLQPSVCAFVAVNRTLVEQVSLGSAGRVHILVRPKHSTLLRPRRIPRKLDADGMRVWVRFDTLGLG